MTTCHVLHDVMSRNLGLWTNPRFCHLRKEVIGKTWEGNSVAPSRPYNFRPSSFTSHKSNSTALRETHLDTAFLAVPLRTIDHFHHHVLPQPQLDPSTGNRKSFSITISGSIPYLFSTPRLERREHPYVTLCTTAEFERCLLFGNCHLFPAASNNPPPP